jgi:hypothetical protein
LCECSSEVLCASVLVKCLCECYIEVLCTNVLVKSGLENRDYGLSGSASLTMRHPFIRKVWN